MHGGKAGIVVKHVNFTIEGGKCQPHKPYIGVFSAKRKMYEFRSAGVAERLQSALLRI